MIKESRCDSLSAGVGASEDTGVADAADGVFCDCGCALRHDAEMVAALDTGMMSPMPTMRSGVEADNVGADAVMTDDPAEFGDCGDMVDVVGEDRSAGMSQERDVWGA